MTLPVLIEHKIETVGLDRCPKCGWVPAIKIDYVGNSGQGCHYFKCDCVQFTSGTMDLKESVVRWNKMIEKETNK